ncbi:MAG: WD40 repeat domain-containing protein [Anaerolineae bacterium]
MRFALIALFLTMVALSPAAAQDSPESPPFDPILWLSEQPSGDQQVFTWDGEQAVNLTPDAGGCRDLFRVSSTQWGWMCAVDEERRLFLWDGSAVEIIPHQGSIAGPTFARDGRIAWWIVDSTDSTRWSLAVWNPVTQSSQIISGVHDWVGDFYTYSSVLDWLDWLDDGRLVWSATQNRAETFGVYVWDGQGVTVIAEGLHSPEPFLRLTVNADDHLFWRSIQTNPVSFDAVVSLTYWDGQQTTEIMHGADVLGDAQWSPSGRSLAGWVKPTLSGSYQMFVWDSITGESTVFPPDEDSAMGFFWLPNGHLVWYRLVQGWDTETQGTGEIHLWDGVQDRDVTPEIGVIRDVQPSPAHDSALITADRDGTRSFYVWSETGLVNVSHDLENIAVGQWTPSGNILIRSGENPYVELSLWDGDTTTLITDQYGVQGYPYAWGSDGSLVFPIVDEAGVPHAYVWNGLPGDASAITLIEDGLFLTNAKWQSGSLLLQLSTVLDLNADEQDIYLWDGTQAIRLSDNPGWDGFEQRYFEG